MLARKLCQEINYIAYETELKSDFKLRDQIKASSGSIMDNIAEGFERNGNKEFRQFLSISKGSCGETRSQLYRIYDRKYIGENKFNELKDITSDLGFKIGSFMKYLNNTGFKGSKFKA